MDTESRLTDKGIELPTDDAEHAVSVGDLDAPPATLEEWWAVLSEQFLESHQTVIESAHDWKQLQFEGVICAFSARCEP